MFIWVLEKDMNNHPLGYSYSLDATSINHNWYGLKPSKYSQNNYKFGNKRKYWDPDNASEETFHMYTDMGYGEFYPQIFGRKMLDYETGRLMGGDTSLTKAMDIARGGFFISGIDEYPSSAWYTLKDQIEYGSFMSEYIHWGMISLLDMNKLRRKNIIQGNQWHAYSPKLMEEKDPLLTSLLRKPEYRFPKNAPDGTYNPKEAM